MKFLFVALVGLPSLLFGQKADSSFSFYSRSVGDSFAIKIGLKTSDPLKAYCSVYTLDGDETFLGATLALKALNDSTTNWLIVSIGYGAGYGQKGNHRDRDYSPTQHQDLPGGRFLTFLATELVPLVEKRYRVEKDRSLIGYSAGANFCLYTLLTKPKAFAHYFAGSIGSSLDSAFLFSMIEKIQPPKSNATVFITAGSKEPWALEKQQEVVTAFAKTKLKNLTVRSEVFEGQTHGYLGAFVFIRTALQQLLSKEALKQH